jgi:hypothetical protein
MSKIFCFAANDPILSEFRSENAHVALLHSAFRASFTQNRPHFRLKQKYLDMLLEFKETIVLVSMASFANGFFNWCI